MKPVNLKYDVIVIGELNVDLIINRLAAFPEIGKEKLAKDMALTLGSSAAIFASNLAGLGSRVAFIGKIGKDLFGEFVLKCLRRKKVDTQRVIQSEEVATGATIGLNFSEDRAMVTFPGAMDHISFDDIPLATLDLARHLHISSYFFQPALRNDIGKIFRIAIEKGLTTSFDIQSDPHDKWDINLHEILPYVDIFIPNHNELLQLTRTNSVDAAIEAIRDHVNILIVKLGNKGSISFYQRRSMHQPAFTNHYVIDTIGAGDSFDAGFIHKFINDAPIETCQCSLTLRAHYPQLPPAGHLLSTVVKKICRMPGKSSATKSPTLKASLKIMQQNNAALLATHFYNGDNLQAILNTAANPQSDAASARNTSIPIHMGNLSADTQAIQLRKPEYSI